MKKVIVFILSIIMVASMCSCSPKEEAADYVLDNPITIVDNNIIKIDVVNFDDTTGYYTFKIYNNSDRVLNVDSSSATVDGKYSADILIWSSDIAPGTVATEASDISDAEGWYGVNYGHSFEISFNVYDNDFNLNENFIGKFGSKDFGIEESN